jgi:cation/acetate symporter
MGGSNLIALHIADIVGSDALMGFISAVAFATILAAVSGLLIAGGSSVANDLIKGIFGKTLSARTNLRAFRITVILLGVVAVFLAIVFEGQNVAYMIAMATSVAASANFPLLMLKLYWRRLTTAGVLVGGAFGLVSSVVLIVLGPTVWTKVFGMGPCLFPYDSPAIFTVPATFVVCILVSLYSRRRVVKMVRAVS